MLKKAKLRYNEYYDMQKVFDSLYAASKNGNNFYKLLEIIGSEENIRLAYRNLKTNSGSNTAGTDGKTIEDIKTLTDKEVIDTVRTMLDDFKPKSVRRVFIPKPGSDKKRPLGIPCIWDRLVQQCILQVLEPICEPKFHNHSYGFRPNRGADHAISRAVSMVNMFRHYYCVDVDIKGFFDNVDHGKLLKQIWTLGIRDKRLICIISKILKSEIEGEGIPTKGTPQGGIISPLLSLIVLNELDWWVSDQWETYQPKRFKSKKSFYSYARNYTNLKDGFIVRYADDFKIMCRTYDEAQRWYYATVDFLKTRLKLDVSPEKSKVINMKKNSSTYLGFKIKVVPKGKTRYGFIAKTDMSDKAIRKAKTNLKAKIINIQKHTSYIAIENYNSAVRGIQNYYSIATNVYNNLTDVSYALLPTIRIRLRDISKTVPFRETDIEFQRKATGIRDETKIVKIGSQTLLPITAVRHKSPMNFSQDTTNYTAKGREKIHSNLEKVTELEFEALARGRDPNESVEFNDNRISAFVVQQGNCYITGQKLNANDMKCIRKIPLIQGGTNKHGNIAFVEPRVFNLIFNDNINEAKIQLAKLKLEESKRNRLNKIRRNYGYQSI
ncbi:MULTISPECIES: group II intron reverse transcriptase/maturase [Clostridia]|jgi:RNA-directed DNA polymerase|uniref:group II intron reverse transcriptase/maturase n=1 Tax=Clostridia TaxID=186801 RepID=UPI001106ECE7|nr:MULTISPECIES: group II intron reverse transcriptase/maturase [Clostridia]MDB6474964.1 group II intron reverse transcriptase/maturase [Blautia wexlerae]